MIPLRVISVHEEHPDLGVRAVAEVTKLTHLAIGTKWAKDLLPEHFRPEARTVFRHAPRTERWRRRKRAMAAVGKVEEGGSVDLVASGLLRRQLLRAVNMVRAYPTRATVDLVGPTYFRRRFGGGPDLVREVLAISPRQERILGETGDRGFAAALNFVRRRRALRKTHRTT